MYKSDDKIIDVRTNLIYVVDCVDHYDEVSLAFTKDKKYIPLEFTKIFVDIIKGVMNWLKIIFYNFRSMFISFWVFIK